ncbi:MAG: glycosyltransferase family 2 protein [Candidatus Helarchaeota archaeon]
MLSVYNSSKFLQQCILSVLNQNFQDFEMILIDDHSTDNSKEIIKDFQKRDKRIKLISNNVNLGPAISRNLGIRQAQGKYIAILDSDDVSKQNRFESQVSFLNSHPEYALIGTNTIIIDISGKFVRKAHFITNENKLYRFMEKNNGIVNPSIMFRNGLDIFYREKFRYSQDYDLFLCLLSRKIRFTNINEYLLYYRYNPSSISFSKSYHQKLFFKKAQEFYFQRKKTGKDFYSTFNPNEILNRNLKKENYQEYLKVKIQESLRIRNNNHALSYCKEYFNRFSYFDVVAFYYLRIFLPNWLNFENFKIIYTINDLISKITKFFY